MTRLPMSDAEKFDRAREREESFTRLAKESGLDPEMVKVAMLAFHRWETGDETREDWTNCAYPGGVVAALVAVENRDKPRDYTDPRFDYPV